MSRQRRLVHVLRGRTHCTIQQARREFPLSRRSRPVIAANLYKKYIFIADTPACGWLLPASSLPFFCPSRSGGQVYESIYDTLYPQMLFEPSSGLLLRDDLHRAFDRFEWSLYCGDVSSALPRSMVSLHLARTDRLQDVL